MKNLILNLIIIRFLFCQIDYNSQIQPIFNAKCTDCHGNSAGLNLSSYENLINGSMNGDVIVPFDHISSELWIRVNSGQMPPGNNDLTSDLRTSLFCFDIAWTSVLACCST